MEYRDLIFEKKGRVACITLNRPKMLNSFSLNLKSEFDEALTEVEKDRELLGLIITGSGKAFSSGTDISEFPGEVEQARRITGHSQELFNRVENLEKPVIAAVNGYALGGGLELALACDIRIASENAKFGFPEVKVGAIPCYGGTQRLTRLLGVGLTKELIFTGKMLGAEEAFERGLVEHLVSAGTELDEAYKLMGEILENAPLAVAYAKKCVNRGVQGDLRDGLSMEADLVSMLVPTHDLKEGSRAFLEKRAPEFKNC